MVLRIEPDITITGSDGMTWRSDRSVEHAVANRVVVIASDEAEHFLRMHSKWVNERFEIYPFPYKITSICAKDTDLNDKPYTVRVVAVGSANPEFSFGGEEQRIMTKLLNGKYVHYCYTTFNPIGGDRFEQELRLRLIDFPREPHVPRRRRKKPSALSAGPKSVH